MLDVGFWRRVRVWTKLFARMFLDKAGLSVVPYVGFTRKEWAADLDRLVARIEDDVDYPCLLSRLTWALLLE